MQISKTSYLLCISNTQDFSDGGIINYLGKSHSLKLNMREYLLDGPMVEIQMCGVDVVIGV